MSFIKINDAESLNIKTIRSYKASNGLQKTVLTITKKDGDNITLSGALAEAALTTLKVHGC